MGIKYDVVARTGTYKKDGQDVQKYTRMGVILETDKGLFLKIEVIPIRWDGWAGLDAPEKRGDSRQNNGQANDNSDIPF